MSFDPKKRASFRNQQRNFCEEAFAIQTRREVLAKRDNSNRLSAGAALPKVIDSEAFAVAEIVKAKPIAPPAVTVELLSKWCATHRIKGIELTKAEAKRKKAIQREAAIALKLKEFRPPAHEYNPPQIDHKLVAQFFGGSFIRKIKFHSVNLEGFDFTKITEYYRNLVVQFLGEDSSIAPLLKQLDDAIEVNNFILDLEKTFPENLHTRISIFVPWIQKRILKLEPGQKLLLLGGWTGSVSSHAMLYEIFKETHDLLTFRSYNTGKGVKYHPAHYDESQRKQMPYLEQTDIPLENLMVPEVWQAYYELLYVRSQHNNYSEKDVYQSFLMTIHPTFGKDQQKREYPNQFYITPQTAGTCTGDCLQAHTRVFLTEFNLFNFIDGFKKAKHFRCAIKFHIIQSYTYYFRHHKIIGAHLPEVIPEDKLIENLNMLHNFEAEVVRFAAETKKGIKRGWICLKEGDEKVQFIKELQKEIRTAVRIYNHRLSSRTPLAEIGQRNVAQLNIPLIAKGNGAEELALIELSRLANLKEATWPKSGDMVLETLKSWMRFEELESWIKINQDNKQALDVKKLAAFSNANVGFLRRAFAILPSAKNPIWKDIPKKDIEQTIVTLSSLVNTFLLSRQKIYERDRTRVEEILHLQKILLIAKQLLMQLPEDGSGVQHCMFENSLTHFFENGALSTRNFFLPITDPRIVQELIDTVEFMREIFGNNPNTIQTMFNPRKELPKQISYVDIEFWMEKDSERFKDANVTEELFIYHEIKRNPEMKKKIEEYLQVNLKRSPPFACHEMITVAISLNMGPPAYSAFRAMSLAILPFVNGQGIFGTDAIIKSAQVKFLGYLCSIEYPHYNRVYDPRGEFFSSRTSDSPRPLTEGYTQNITMVRNKDNDVQFLELQRCMEDKSQQVIKTLAYYAQNYELLNSPYHQTIVEDLLFEGSLLLQQLKDEPESAKILIDFVRNGYRYARDFDQVKAGTFLLRLSSYFVDFCLHTKIDIQIIREFPNIFNELELWSQKPNLSNLEKSRLYREFLAAYVRYKPFSLEELPQLLKKGFHLAEYPLEKLSAKKNAPPQARPIDFDENADAPHIQDDVDKLFENIAVNLKKLSLKEYAPYLDMAIGLNDSSGWNADKFPLIFSLDKQFQISLLEGRLYSGKESSEMPKEILNLANFQKAFGFGSLRKIRVLTFDLVYLEDSDGRQCKINNGKIHKMIRGEWHEHYESSILKKHFAENCVILDRCVCWQGPNNAIIFLDKATGQETYYFDPEKKQLFWPSNPLNKSLCLAKDCTAANFFRSFDSGTRFWKNGEGFIEVVELPNYGFIFKVEYEQDRVKHIVSLSPREGLFLSKQQNLPALKSLPGYLIVENSEGKQEVLIPLRLLSTENEALKKLTPKEHKSIPYIIYSYPIDDKGNLQGTDLEGQLYLSYVYLLQKDYKKAYKILDKKATKLSAYTLRESFLLRLISGVVGLPFKNTDDDARACAIRLKAASVFKKNEERFPEANVNNLLNLPEAQNSPLLSDLYIYEGHEHLIPFFKLAEEEKLSFQSYSNDSSQVLRRGEQAKAQMHEGVVIYQPRFKDKKVLPKDGENLSLTLVDDVLDERRVLLQPTMSQLRKEFLSYYRIAVESKDLSERRRLQAIINLWKNLKITDINNNWFEILQEVFDYPHTFPSTAEVINAIKFPLVAKPQQDGDAAAAFMADYRPKRGLFELEYVAPELEVLEKRQEFVLLQLYKHAKNLYKTRNEKGYVIKYKETEYPASPKKPHLPYKGNARLLALPPVISQQHLTGLPEHTSFDLDKFTQRNNDQRREIDELVKIRNQLRKSVDANSPKQRAELEGLEERIHELNHALHMEESQGYYAFASGAIKESLFIEVPQSEEALKRNNDVHTQLISRLEEAEKGALNRVERKAIAQLKEDVIFFHKTEIPKNYVLRRSEWNNLQKTLGSELGYSKKSTMAMKKEILALANRKPSDPKELQLWSLEFAIGQRKKITLNDLQLMYLRGNLQAVLDLNPNLTVKEAQMLFEKVENFLVAATHEQQLERSLEAFKKVKELEALDDRDPVLMERVKDLHTALTQSRYFDPIKNPEFLLFEFRANISLRKEQVEMILKLSLSEQERYIQLLMGEGKSALFRPLLALKKADGKTLVVLIGPNELQEQTNIDMQTRSGDIFGQVANSLDWQDLTAEKLVRIRKSLLDIIERKEFLTMSDNDVHHFAVNLRKCRDVLCNQSGGEDAFAKMQHFIAIYQLFKTQGKAIIDEIDRVLKSRHEVHITVGNPSRISLLYCYITTELYDVLLTDERISSLVYFDFTQNPKPGSKPFTLQLYEQFKPYLREKVLIKLRENILKDFSEKDFAEIRSYVAADSNNRNAKLPDTLNKELKNALTILRDEFNIILRLTLDNIYGEDYGFFEGENNSRLRWIAGPYDGDKRPQLGSQFGNYVEQINYTRQAFIKAFSSQGLPQKYLEGVIYRIQAAVRNECQLLRLKNATAAHAYNEYIDLVGIDIANKFPLLQVDDKVIKEIALLIPKNPSKLQRFIGIYILPDIQMQVKRISSNSQHLPDMFLECNGFTGTLDSCETFHPRFIGEPKRGIDGMILTLIALKSRHDFTVIDEADPVVRLEKMLASVSKEDLKNYKALIDEGALFKEMSNIKLVNHILRLRPDIEAVVYFENDNRMIFRRGMKPLPHKPQNDVPASKRFTIYDQPHCRGTHVDQDPFAKAWMTLNKSDTLSSAEQAAFRMRKLVGGQKISFISPRDLADVITEDIRRQPDMIDVLIQTAKTKAKQQAEDNLLALHHKMHNVVYQACTDFLNNVNPHALHEPIYRDLNNLLVTFIEDNPYQERMLLEYLEDAVKVLEHYRDHVVLKGLLEWEVKYKDDKRCAEKSFDISAIKKQIDRLIEQATDEKAPHVSEKLLHNPNEAVRDNLLQTTVQIDVQQNVEQQVQQDVKLQQEQELKLKMEEDTEIVQLRSKIQNAQPREQNYKWQDLPKMFNKHFYRQGQDTPWISMEDCFKQCVQNPYGKLKELEIDPQLFGRRFIASKELLYTAEHEMTPFDVLQKPFGPCLLVQDMEHPEIVELYPISGGNAEMFKGALIEDKARPFSEHKRDKRVSLYHPDFGIYQHGSDQQMNLEALTKESSGLREMLVIYKFICGRMNDYDNAEIAILRAWIKSNKNPNNLENLFKRIILRQMPASIIKVYSMSLLAKIFREVQADNLKKLPS